MLIKEIFIARNFFPLLWLLACLCIVWFGVWGVIIGLSIKVYGIQLSVVTTGFLLIVVGVCGILPTLETIRYSSEKECRKHIIREQTQSCKSFLFMLVHTKIHPDPVAFRWEAGGDRCKFITLVPMCRAIVACNRNIKNSGNRLQVYGVERACGKPIALHMRLVTI